MCGVLLRELPRGEKITNGWHNVTCPKCREQIPALSKEQPPCPPT
jgi:ssDNA-binding Zn-finger/Zn-ribbon topoisomerase 1